MNIETLLLLLDLGVRYSMPPHQLQTSRVIEFSMIILRHYGNMAQGLGADDDINSSQKNISISRYSTIQFFSY